MAAGGASETIQHLKENAKEWAIGPNKEKLGRKKKKNLRLNMSGVHWINMIAKEYK